VTSYFHGNAEACENVRPAPRRFYNRNVEELLHKIDAFLCFQSGLEWRTSYNNHPLSKEIALSRKSPKPVPKPSSTSKEHSIIQKRVLYLLDYISRVNRQTLVALHHVGQAPDCQVAKTPSLVQFAHSFKDLEFHVRAFVTESQSTLLQIARDVVGPSVPNGEGTARSGRQRRTEPRHRSWLRRRVQASRGFPSCRVLLFQQLASRAECASISLPARP
jgi:hypothetical protein